MSNHLKRLNSPGSWRIAKKTNTFVTKTAPGPHNASAMPVALWLRDHMGMALTMSEVKRILKSRAMFVNGAVCTDPKMGIGVFDIIALPSVDKVLPDSPCKTRRYRLSSHYGRSSTEPPLQDSGQDNRERWKDSVKSPLRCKYPR